MATHGETSALVHDPKISRDKILDRMEKKGIKQAAMADKLGVTGGAVSRGLSSQAWLKGKIQAIADILQASPVDFTVEESIQLAGSTIERICQIDQNGAYSLPPGACIQMLFIGGRWGVYLLGPPGKAVNTGDFVVLQSSDSAAPKIGRLITDEACASRVVLMTDGQVPRAHSVERDAIASVRLIIAALGGQP
jgi:transcriptional regulator with XRE-family HTH domain